MVLHAEDEEFTERADEWMAEMVGPGHSFQLPLLLLSWEFCPPTVDEGSPGGPALCCWVILDVILLESSTCDTIDFTM